MPFDFSYESEESDVLTKPDESDHSTDSDQSTRSTIRRRPAARNHIFDSLDENGELRENHAQALMASNQLRNRPNVPNAQALSTMTAAERRKDRPRSPSPSPSFPAPRIIRRQSSLDTFDRIPRPKIETSQPRDHDARRARIPPLQHQQNDWASAQNVWTASTKHDVTLHFELGIAHDIESKLEEFSELKRLGHFHAAEQFYQDSLESFSGLYPIAIEYADMLAEQGAFERVHQFIAEKNELLTSTEHDPERQQLQGGEEGERFNLQLIAAYSAIHTHGKLKEAYSQVLSVENAIRSISGENIYAVAWEPLGIALYALKILSLVEQETDLVSEHSFDIWSNCYSMYKTFVVQDRIWDARDMIAALVESDRPINTWRWIFNADVHSRDAFTQLFADWNVQEYDLSTYLAILDILVTTARGLSSFLPDEKDLLAAERCLQHARTVATCLKENSPHMVKSRSYMQWVLAEEDLQRKKLTTDDSLKAEDFLGLKIMKGALPIYVPIKSENPTWRVVYGQSKTQSVALLESTLQAARELGDYVTEASCIEQIISRSPEPPEERFAQLCHLQKNLMRDVFEYRRTCLSMFLLAETDYMQRQILDELEMIRTQRETSFNDSFSDWCEVMIDKALCESLGISSNHAREDLSPFSIFLPQFVKDILEEVGLDRIYALDFKSKPRKQT